MSAPTAETLSVLRRGPFARYIAGESVSMLGTWMQQMAQGWVMTTLTSSAFALGWVNFASGLPMLLLTMHGGMVADRYDKRLVLIAALVVQSALAVGIGLLIGSDRIEVWHVVVAGICLGVVTAFEMPAAAALVPELVAREQVSAAIAIDRSVFHATRLAGPALGGWLIAALGTAAAFFANAISYTALMVALLTIQPRAQASAADEALRQTGIGEGIRYVRQDPPTRAVILLLMLATVFISPFFMVLMPLYSRYILNVGAQQHGLLMAASGVGALIGSVHLLSIPHHRRAAYLRAATVGAALAMAALGSAGTLLPALAAMAMLTIGTSTIFGLANTIAQERAPDPLRGRVSALVGLSFFGVLPFSGLAMSAFADFAGMRTALLISAASFCLGGLLLCRSNVLSSPIAARQDCGRESLSPAEQEIRGGGP